MSSCLSGGAGRSYSIDIDIVKSTSASSTRTSHSSSPSSTLSDSSNSPITISTRKPRTPRKRPNQTYNEAAALLSTVYPNIFSIKNLTKPFKHSKLQQSQPCNSFSSEECSELLPSFPTLCRDEFLIHHPIPEKPKFRIEYKPVNSSENPCQSPVSSSPCENLEENFDAESMLDEEMEEGIDSIMGNLCVEADAIDHSDASYYHSHINFNPYYGNSILGFGGRFEFGGVSALRNVDNGDWWMFPTVDVVDISPKLTTTTTSNKSPSSQKKKKKKKVEKEEEETELPPLPPSSEILDSSKEPTDSKSIADSNLNLKLNYDDVLVAWSDRGSPFSDDISEADAIARLAQIDLFGENGGVREASVLRYREKRRTRLFSKKIRYQVRKVNADRRPRMKGRFVRRPTSMGGGGQR